MIKTKAALYFLSNILFMGIDPNGLKDSLGNDYFLQGKTIPLSTGLIVWKIRRNIKGIVTNAGA